MASTADSSEERGMRQALTAWGLADAVARPWPDGVRQPFANRHWRVAGDYLLRRYAARRTLEAARYEHDLLAFLDERSWPVPAPIAAADGSTIVEADRARWALFPLMPGEPAPDLPIALQRRGALLALLHEDLATRAAVQHETFGRLDDLDAVVHASGQPSFDALVENLRRTDAGHADALAALRERSADALVRTGYAHFPQTVIWGACTAEHVLFEVDEVTALLDFDGARLDARAVDIAASLLTDGATHDGANGMRVHRWVAGYCAHAVPPLHVIEANLVPVAITALALRAAAETLAEAFAAQAAQTAESGAGRIDAATLATIDAASETEAAEAALRRVIRTAAGHPSA